MSAACSFTTSDGVRLSYLDVGRGRPLLFVPGWSMTASVWDLQLAGLDGYRCIALDPRGQGDSERTDSGQFSERRALDLCELVEALGLDGVVLVGWSMGGGEVMECAVGAGSARVSGVVVVDSYIRFPTEHWSLGYASIRPLLRARPEWTDAFMTAATAPNVAPEYRRALAAASASMLPAGAYALLLDYMLTDRTELCQRCSRPLLYAYCDASESQAALLKEHVPTAQFERFTGASHMLFRDDPTRFNQMLAAFVERSR